jgi:4-hydroxy-tetrahydrodipicolinate reductase
VGGIVGRHEIIFGFPNQTLRLTHDSISRAAFGQGALYAIKNLYERPAGFYTMEQLVSEGFSAALA